MIVKARFDGRVFVPEGPVDLPAGSLVEIPVGPAAASPSLLGRLAEMAGRLPANPDWPEDGAAEHDHRLRGGRAGCT